MSIAVTSCAGWPRSLRLGKLERPPYEKSVTIHHQNLVEWLSRGFCRRPERATFSASVTDGAAAIHPVRHGIVKSHRRNASGYRFSIHTDGQQLNVSGDPIRNERLHALEDGALDGAGRGRTR